MEMNKNHEDFGVEINSEIFNKDYDDVQFEPIVEEEETDNKYEY